MPEPFEPGRARSNPRDATHDTPESLEETLDRAALHARAAGSEALTALQYLVEAAALASEEAPPAAKGPLTLLARAGEELSELLARPWDLRGSRLGTDLARALDEQIKRWENRAHTDPNARTVLRVFLAVRESLWEMGIRTTPEPSTSNHPATAGM
ncbi:hypothetical protein MK489_12840 [Myxococcota bacterium]|nr:hypothetical protein [Myxococcota bacterium]